MERIRKVGGIRLGQEYFADAEGSSTTCNMFKHVLFVSWVL